MKKILPFIFILITGCHTKDSDKTLQIKAIDAGVYLHTSYKLVNGFGWVDSNGLVVVNNKQAVIVDTPWSEVDTAELLSWISAQGLMLEASISTHFHEDRTAGIALLNSKSIPTYTSELTDEILKSKDLPRGSEVFTGDSLQLLGGLIEVYYPGAGHTKDNLVVWLPEKSMLFGGCLVRPMAWSSLGFTGDADISQWVHSVSKVQAKYPGVEKIVPGHGMLGDQTILKHTIELAVDAQ